MFHNSPVQRIRMMDVITPQELQRVVEGAFLDVSRDSDYHVGNGSELALRGIRLMSASTARQVHCIFEDLVVAWDFQRWFDRQGQKVFPFILRNYTKRQDTVHVLNFHRSRKFYNDPGRQG